MSQKGDVDRFIAKEHQIDDDHGDDVVEVESHAADAHIHFVNDVDIGNEGDDPNIGEDCDDANIVDEGNNSNVADEINNSLLHIYLIQEPRMDLIKK